MDGSFIDIQHMGVSIRRKTRKQRKQSSSIIDQERQTSPLLPAAYYSLSFVLLCPAAPSSKTRWMESVECKKEADEERGGSTKPTAV